MSYRYHDQGKTGIATGSDMYYVGMIVSLKPLTGQRLADLLEWYNLEWRIRWDDEQPVYFPFRRLLEPAYLKGTWHGERFGPFFDMLAADDFRGLGESFDASIITNDRPFPSCPTTSEPEVLRALVVTSGICVALGGLFAIGAMRGIRRPHPHGFAGLLQRGHRAGLFLCRDHVDPGLSGRVSVPFGLAGTGTGSVAHRLGDRWSAGGPRRTLVRHGRPGARAGRLPSGSRVDRPTRFGLLGNRASPQRP